MARWIVGLAAVLLLPACGGGGSSDRPDPVGTSAGAGAGQALSVRIISPASGATSPEGSTITIEAELSGPTDAVARVDFYQDNRRIGGVSSPPYVLSYGPLKEGASELCAGAVDSEGNAEAASSPVTLFVVQGTGDHQVDDPSDGGRGHDLKH